MVDFPRSETPRIQSQIKSDRFVEEILDEIELGGDEVEADEFGQGIDLKKPVPVFTEQESVDVIVEGVLRKLVPILEAIKDRQDRGVLVGTREIGRYMGVGSGAISNWYKNKGFPLSKNAKGKWWITKGMADRWMYERCILMRKLYELGYRTVSGMGSGGYLSYAQPEKYTQVERDHASREILKDRLNSQVGTNV